MKGFFGYLHLISVLFVVILLASSCESSKPRPESEIICMCLELHKEGLISAVSPEEKDSIFVRCYIQFIASRDITELKLDDKIMDQFAEESCEIYNIHFLEN